ncbi:MAG: hypothetical protein IT379_39635 [Deltaproteobacteria bacterium]|nr:hypothetical protein [Deltaproteobacteria bacterium]
MASAMDLIARTLSNDQLLTRHSLAWARISSPVGNYVLRRLADQGYSRTTVARCAYALRSMRRLYPDLPPLELEPLPVTQPASRVVQPVGYATLGRLRDGCDDGTPLGCRDGLVVELLREKLSAGQIVRLRLGDWEDRKLVVRLPKSVRRIRLADPTIDAMEAWVAHRGPEDGPLIAPVRRHTGAPVLRALRPEAVGEILRRRARLAGLARVPRVVDVRGPALRAGCHDGQG